MIKTIDNSGVENTKSQYWSNTCDRYFFMHILEYSLKCEHGSYVQIQLLQNSAALGFAITQISIGVFNIGDERIYDQY